MAEGFRGNALSHFLSSSPHPQNLKTDITNREEMMQDTSSLGKIKEAMTKIKSEINDMELRIGVCVCVCARARLCVCGTYLLMHLYPSTEWQKGT